MLFGGAKVHIFLTNNKEFFQSYKVYRGILTYLTYPLQDKAFRTIDGGLKTQDSDRKQQHSLRRAENWHGFCIGHGNRIKTDKNQKQQNRYAKR